MRETTSVATKEATFSAAHMSLPYKSYVLVLTLMIYALSYIDRTLAGVLAPLIKTDLKLTDTELGLINGAAFAFIYGVFTVPFGWLADRFSRTRIICGALLFWSAATAMFGFGASFAQLAAARAGTGLGEAAGGAPCQSLLLDYFPHSQRARAMAIYGFGVPIGIASGAVIGGLIAAWWGWRAAFLAAGVLGIGLSVLFKLTVKEPVRIVQEGESSVPEPFFRSIGIMLRKPGYIFACLGCTSGVTAGLATYFWVPSYMARSYALDLTAISTLYGAIQLLGGIGGAAIGGYVSDRLALRTSRAPALVAGFGYLAACPLLVGLVLAGDARIAWWFLFLTTIATSLGNGPLVATVQHFATPVLRGTASALLNFALMFLAMGLGVPLVGILSDQLTQRYAEEALRYALLSLPIFYLVGGCLLFTAGRWMATAPRKLDGLRNPDADGKAIASSSF